MKTRPSRKDDINAEFERFIRDMNGCPLPGNAAAEAKYRKRRASQLASAARKRVKRAAQKEEAQLERRKMAPPWSTIFPPDDAGEMPT